jgi:hypothetical protein
MDSSFDVIDLNSGNVTGGFNSEDDALASLRRAVGAHGPRAIQDLSLMRSTDDDQIVVAMQDDLERRVRDSSLGMVGASF